MSENYIAKVEGGRIISRIFAKPVYAEIVVYLAKMRWHSQRRSHSRTMEEIQKEICKNSDFKPEDINLNILEMIVKDGWIMKIQGETKNLPEYEIVDQGNELAFFLRKPEISALFKP